MAKDSWGWSGLDWAKINDHSELAAFLRGLGVPEKKKFLD